jgi:hypothetical protein
LPQRSSAVTYGLKRGGILSGTPYSAPSAFVTDPPEPDQPQPIRLGGYIATFTAALIAAIAAVVSVVVFGDYDPHGSITLIETLFAASLTGLLFVRNNKRIPSAEERRKLIWLSFGASWVVSLISIGGVLGYVALTSGVDDLMQGVSEMIPRRSVLAWAIVGIGTLGLTYISVHLGYGFVTNWFGRRLPKKSAP